MGPTLNIRYRSICIVVLFILVSMFYSNVRGDTQIWTTTNDFNIGTKSIHAYEDGVLSVETETDNPHVSPDVFTLGRIAGDNFTRIDSDSNSWRWYPVRVTGEGCSGLGGTGFLTSINGGNMNLSITRDASTAWGYVRSSFVLNGDFDVSLFLNDTSLADSDELLEYQMSTTPNGCWFNSPAPEGVFYRAYRACVTSTCLRMQAFRVSGGIDTQVGGNTDLSVLSLCVRITRSGNVFTWYHDIECDGSWTQDETTTQSMDSRLYPILTVSDQIGASDAATYLVDNFRVTSGTVEPIGSRVTGDNSTYEGIADYDPQIFTNSRGEMLYITGRGTVSPERIHVRYSLTGGQTWSDRIILFSNAAQGDGIIDSDLGGMWEFSGELIGDVLYLVMHLCPSASCSRNAFTKIDISDVRNVITFSNWKSANGVSVPSIGNGSDGSGYDYISSSGYIDPSIAVFNADDIWVTMISIPVVDSVYITRWNGVSWSVPSIIYDDLSNLAVGLSRIRRLFDGDLVHAFSKTQIDGFNPSIVQRCDKSMAANCSSSASWTGMDGAGMFDYVIDTGAGAFHWPIIYEDSFLRLHVVSVSAYLISGFSRLFHNYYSGGVWVNSETENSAGIRIDVTISGTSEPRVVNDPRAMWFNVDTGGQIILLISSANGPKGAGIYSFLWNGSFTEPNYRFRHFGGGIIVGSGIMRDHETISSFLISNVASPIMQVGFAPGGIASGTDLIHTFRMFGDWISPSYNTGAMRVTNVVVAHTNLGTDRYIDRLVVSNATVSAAFETNIVSGTETTFTLTTDVVGTVNVRLYLASLGRNSPIIGSLTLNTGNVTVPPSVGGPAISVVILSLVIIVFLFAAGIVHPIFWFLDAFVCFYATSAFTADYPNTLWAFVFLSFGVMLLIVATFRFASIGLGGTRR